MQNLQGSVLVLLWILFSGAGQQRLHSPSIVFNQPSFDLGEIRQGEKNVHEFLFMNRGGGTLEIEKVVPD